ncbi:MAG: alanine racemase [Candidatus Kapabacteria bacterium]|nr:alanine racemase [Candidatus Kapabacteria bacterium]
MRSTVAVIDLDALEWNVGRVRARAAGRAVLGMVKANAYGHGMIEIARVLDELGLEVLGTAFVDEAIALRRAGITRPILVLTPVEAHEIESVVELGLITVACDIDQVRALSAVAQQRGARASVHLYVDTGMLREGFRPHEALDASRILRQLPGISLDGLCTHFATADEPDSSFLREQLSTFEQTHRQLVDDGCSFVWVHAANTGAVWQSTDTHFTLVRPGISIYGYDHALGDEMTLRPVMSIRSRVVSLRRAWPGDTVSYGRRHMVSNETTIVTVPIGYGDGYLRGLSGRAECLIGGRRYPVVGSVCMDELMVDVADAPVAIGQEVVLLGRQAGQGDRFESIDAVELAGWAGTIPYEITTAVSQRVPRIYIGRLAHGAQGAMQEIV